MPRSESSSPSEEINTEQPEPTTNANEETRPPSPISTSTPEEIVFANHPPTSTCTLEDIAIWMNDFSTLEKQGRALYWMVKKLIDVRDAKNKPREEGPQFLHLPNIPSKEENTPLEKILKQARMYQQNQQTWTTINIPKELKTVEIQKIQEGIFQKDKVRVTGMESLKNYQHFLRSTFHQHGFEGIADLITTQGNFKDLQEKYSKIYEGYLTNSGEATSQDRKNQVVKACKQENKLLFHTLRTKFLWHPTLKQKMDNLLTLREDELPATMIGLVALDFIRETFNTVTLDAIITATMKIMTGCIQANQHNTFESWNLNYLREINEYKISYGEPSFAIIRLANAYLTLKAQNRYGKILDYHRLSFPTTMTEILDNAEEIRHTLEEAATKWDINITSEPHNKGFKKRDDKHQRASTYSMISDMLGMEPKDEIHKPHTYVSTEPPKDCSYCGQRHPRSMCDYIKSDKMLKENVGTIIPHVVKLAETLEKSLFEIRKKKSDFGSKEMKQLGQTLERFQNRDINTLMIAGKRIRDLYDKRPKPNNTVHDKGDKRSSKPPQGERTTRQQTERASRSQQDRPTRPQRDRSTSLPRKPATNTTDKTKKTTGKKTNTKKLTFNMGDELSTTKDAGLIERYAGTTDEEETEAYGYTIHLATEVPDNWESLAEENNESVKMEKSKLDIKTPSSLGETKSLQDYANSFDLQTQNCGFCNNYHATATCWLKIEQDKLDKDEEEPEAYGYIKNITTEVPDNWESLAEEDDESVNREETKLEITSSLGENRSFQDYANSFDLLTKNCEFCNNYHATATCWLKIEQDKLDKDVEEGLIDEDDYNQKSAKLYHNPSGSGTGKSELPFGSDTEDYWTLMSAQTADGEFILSNPINNNCLYSAIRQAIHLSDKNHTTAIDKIYKSIFKTYASTSEIDSLKEMRQQNALHLEHLYTTKSNAFINTLTEELCPEEIANYSKHISKKPEPSCMLEVASISDLLDLPIEIMRETHTGKLASYVYLLPKGISEPPFRKSKMESIKLLLKDNHFNLILPANSALAPDKTLHDNEWNCPITSPNVHWHPDVENKCPTPPQLKLTKRRMEHNLNVEALTQQCLEMSNESPKARAPLLTLPVFTATQRNPTLSKTTAKYAVVSPETYGTDTGSPTNVLERMTKNIRTALKDDPMTFNATKASSKRSLFEPYEKDQKTVPLDVNPDIEAGKDIPSPKIPTDKKKTLMRETGNTCALPTCNIITTICQLTGIPQDFCTGKHAIIGGKLLNPYSRNIKEYDWNGHQCTNMHTHTQGAKISIQASHKAPSDETLQAQKCALPGCQDNILDVDHPGVPSVISNNFCCMTHAIIGGAYTPEHESNFVASCSWDGTTCHTLTKPQYAENLKMKFETQTLAKQATSKDDKISELTNYNKFLLAQLAKHEDKIENLNNTQATLNDNFSILQDKLQQARTEEKETKNKIKSQIESLHMTDAAIIKTLIAGAKYVNHWTIQISKTAPFKAAGLTTRLNKILHPQQKHTLRSIATKMHNYKMEDQPDRNVTEQDIRLIGHTMTRLTCHTINNNASTTLLITGDYASIPLGLALFHELTSSTSRKNLGYEATPTTEITLRINDGIDNMSRGQETPSNMEHDASKSLDEDSITMLVIRHTEAGRDYVLRRAKAQSETNKIGTPARTQKRKEKPSPPHQLHPWLMETVARRLTKNELQRTSSSPTKNKSSPETKKHQK